MELREIMTESVITASPGDSVRRVAELMRDRNVGSVVLVNDGGAPVGIITDRDLAIGPLADGSDLDEAVESCATTPVISGESDMELDEAAALMVSHRIRRLPVLDAGELAGIVTLDDIAVRTGNLEIAQQMTADIARAALPEFYFHQRGG
jgi:CBS domain-containing protein